MSDRTTMDDFTTPILLRVDLTDSTMLCVTHILSQHFSMMSFQRSFHISEILKICLRKFQRYQIWRSIIIILLNLIQYNVFCVGQDTAGWFYVYTHCNCSTQRNQGEGSCCILFVSYFFGLKMHMLRFISWWLVCYYNINR